MKNTKILFSADQIDSRVKMLANDIRNDWAEKEMTVIALLKGGLIFLADLIRHLERSLVFDVMGVKSYSGKTESCGEVQLLQDITADIKGKQVLLVDDILDTGLTLSWVQQHLLEKGADNVKTCVLLDKPARRVIAITPDYCGFCIENKFVVGYGMDYDDKYRNLGCIAVLKDPDKDMDLHKFK
ncbi:MAG: hypoxanthine phosphoribosyltransferase [Candidatus Theseobacter exili]|nr:hypoxanthine phosphoribosyltransferase [Candidatus Theseobacter exili]